MCGILNLCVDSTPLDASFDDRNSFGNWNFDGFSLRKGSIDSYDRNSAVSSNGPNSDHTSEVTGIRGDFMFIDSVVSNQLLAIYFFYFINT